jgi:hypothetical protein
VAPSPWRLRAGSYAAFVDGALTLRGGEVASATFRLWVSAGVRHQLNSGRCSSPPELGRLLRWPLRSTCSAPTSVSSPATGLEATSTPVYAYALEVLDIYHALIERSRLNDVRQGSGIL